jgi:hypothetical protein
MAAQSDSLVTPDFIQRRNLRRLQCARLFTSAHPFRRPVREKKTARWTKSPIVPSSCLRSRLCSVSVFVFVQDSVSPSAEFVSQMMQDS